MNYKRIMIAGIIVYLAIMVAIIIVGNTFTANNCWQFNRASTQEQLNQLPQTIQANNCFLVTVTDNPNDQGRIDTVIIYEPGYSDNVGSNHISYTWIYTPDYTTAVVIARFMAAIYQPYFGITDFTHR